MNSATDLTKIEQMARREQLSIFGAFHPGPEDLAPEGTGTLLLLGLHEPGYWAHLTRSPEWRDGASDPVDRWSSRVIDGMAEALGGRALFPFGGPPYEPFFRWALASGQAWQSPVSLLVHARAGLMVSYRGAIALSETLQLPQPSERPCETCHRPCLTACTARALTSNGYDVAACHNFLDTEAGAVNLSNGCAVRRSCPVSHKYGRLSATSAYHMSIFHK